ncbi:uncharacterized protein LOC108511571 [Phoenix dactylifera]|uniref:Uncharacterized protein LOC108511571 n=1 Tax=Phoenix dactylifera TaxID=42345 RepID=A0A8B9API4_PHODC|nr:uncharacterized protein LOC108511571 [Phoenix dactylifera]
MNPIQPASKPTDIQPAQDLESKPKPVSSQRKLDKQGGQLLESGENSKPDSKEQPKAKAEGNHEINPSKNQEPDKIIEGFNEDESKTQPEIQPQKPQTEARDELKKRNEAKPSSTPLKAGEIRAELRISKPEHSKKQDNVARKETAQNGSSGKESKIAISTMPWASFSDGERAPFEKETKEGLSRLVLKLDVGHLERIGNGQPVSMITLAGENNGASMVIGSDTQVPRGNIEASWNNAEERWKHRCTEDPALTANVNSNAQSINNSALHRSSCNARDPGVHLNLSSKKVEAASPRGQTEPLKPEKTAPRVTPDQRPSHEPRVRRRCLRGLFMESSESDPENPQKPQRHGCRFCCEEKKKGKADTDATSTPNSNARARQAEEGTSRA